MYEDYNNFNEDEINKEEEGGRMNNNKNHPTKSLDKENNKLESWNLQEYEDDLKFDDDFEQLQNGEEELGEKSRNEKSLNELEIIDGENL